MKTLPGEKSFEIPLVGAMLDGISAAGEAGHQNLRVVLNVDHTTDGTPNRSGGWRKLGVGNEDLHDQLLGGQGWWALITEAATIAGGIAESTIKVDDWEWILPDDILTIGGKQVRVTSAVAGNVLVVNSGATFSVAAGDAVIKVTPGQREAVSLLYPCTNSSGSRCLLAFTRSRVYASTGSARNFRIIADELGGYYRSTDPKFGAPRWDVAKLGDWVVFTNNEDPVMAWRIGAPPVTEGVDKKRRWSAIEVYDLLGLGITSAGCVWEWNGYLFLGDVVVNGVRYSDRIYWCDFNRPLEWAPGGESVAGYYEVGAGQTVLRGARIGGSMRVYTDKSILVGELIGGDAVFRFPETYSGPRVMVSKWSLVNAGDTHYYLSADGIVSLSKFDPSPNQVEWLRRASGLITRGLNPELLRGSRIGFNGFGPIDTARCHEVAVGFHEALEEMWICWPTVTADANSFGGIRRGTMRISLRHGKASLVDHAFSAFAEWTPDHRMSVRDFMVTYCICDAPGVVDPKEGVPLNEILPQCSGLYGGPNHIINVADDGTGVVHPDSVCSMMGDLTVNDMCPTCVESPVFVAASLSDLCLKEMAPNFWRREMYVASEDDPAVFPATSPGLYSYDGYPTMLQGEASNVGFFNEKLISGVGVMFDAVSASAPGQVRCQLAANNSANCANWYDADPLELSCLPSGATPDEHMSEQTRAGEFPTFAFHQAGINIGWRLWVEGAPSEPGMDGPVNPIDCGFSATTVKLMARPFRSTWRKAQ